MTADETMSSAPQSPTRAGVTSAPEAFPEVGPVAAAKVGAKDVQANFSTMGSVLTGSLSATGSAIGMASVDGDATITASFAPAVMSKGDTTVQQSYVSAVIVGRGATTSVHQAFAPLIVGKTMDLTQAGGGVLVTGQADVKNSWVGIVLAPKATISDDSRVIISTKAALIIALALFGGLGLVALALTLGVRRVSSWRPRISLPTMPAHPSMPQMPAMPDFAALQEKWHHLRHSA